MLSQLFSQKRILGGAAVLAAMQFGASVMGLLRDRILASTFPELGVTDVYIASFRPSDLCFQMIVMSAFSVALVPLLAEHHSKGDRGEMNRLLSSVLFIGSVVFGLVSLGLFFVMPNIAHVLVGFTGERLELYITFARLALLTNFLFVFGNACGQYLITIQKYWVYGLTPILYTLGTILGTLYLTPHVGAFGPMYGTLGGACVYVVLRLVGVFMFGFRPGGAALHPQLKEMFVLMLPRVAALGALQFQLLLFDTVASGLDAGAVTINAYARNFQAVCVGVAGIALAQSTFSLLSQAAASKEWNRYRIYLKKGTTILLALTIPGAVALVLLAPVAASLVSLSHVLSVFTLCLAYYAISIPFESINHLLLRAFYALKHTLTPAIFSVLNGLLAIAVAWLLAPQFGVYSLAIGFTVGQVIQLLGLSVFLRLRLSRV